MCAFYKRWLQFVRKASVNSKFSSVTPFVWASFNNYFDIADALQFNITIVIFIYYFFIWLFQITTYFPQNETAA